jgi:tetratricopeptide (TPR) repeat protein
VQLLENRGDRQEAERWTAALLAGFSDNPLYLAHAARGAFRRKDVPSGRWWTDRLEQRHPKSWEAAEMAARLLHAEGNGREAVDRIEKIVDAHEEFTAGAAALLEELGQRMAAELMYRRDASIHRPESVLRCALFLGRQGRTDEALELCSYVWRSGPVETAARVSVAVLRLVGKPKDDQVQRVKDWLEQGLAKNLPPTCGWLEPTCSTISNGTTNRKKVISACWTWRRTTWWR